LFFVFFCCCCCCRCCFFVLHCFVFHQTRFDSLIWCLFLELNLCGNNIETLPDELGMLLCVLCSCWGVRNDGGFECFGFVW
jgi:hypothetical protein